MKKVLKNSIMLVALVALFVVNGMSSYAAHTHSWSGETLYQQYYVPGDTVFSCNKRISIFLKTCLTCGENSTRTITVQLSHHWVSTDDGGQICVYCGSKIGPAVR